MSHMHDLNIAHDPFVTSQPSEPYIAPERFDVYHAALRFQSMVARIAFKGHREIRDQLERASISTILNTAEGIGRRSGIDKARFYSIARGSEMECAAIIDVVRSLGLASIVVCRDARTLQIRIVQMLTKLEVSARKL